MEYCSTDSLDTALTAFNRGEGVSLCRGGSWNIEKTLRFRSENTAWGSHGEGDRPLIKSDSGVFKMFYGLSGFDIRDIDMIGSGKGESSGIQMSGGIHNVTIENINISDFYIGITDQGGGSNLIVRDMIIRNSLRQGFYGGGDNLLIENVKFYNNGTHKSLDHNIYISGGHEGEPSTNLIFRDIYSEGSSGVHFVVHGKIDGMLIDNFRAIGDIKRMGAWGFAATAGYDNEQEYFHNIEIKNSYFENTGNNFLTATDCEGAYVHDSEFVFKGSPPTTIYGVRLPRQNADGPTETVRVIDNTFWIIDPQPGAHIICIDLAGLTGEGDARGNKIFYDNPVEGVKITVIKGRENGDIGDNYFGREEDYKPPNDTPVDLIQEELDRHADRIKELTGN